MYELWRDIVSFRKQFTELKGTTERDLMRVKNDLSQTGRSLTSACFGFLTNAKTAETQGQVRDDLSSHISMIFFPQAVVERERNDRVNLEKQLREKTREIADLQQRYIHFSSPNLSSSIFYFQTSRSLSNERKITFTSDGKRRNNFFIKSNTSKSTKNIG